MVWVYELGFRVRVKDRVRVRFILVIDLGLGFRLFLDFRFWGLGCFLKINALMFNV